MNLSEVRSFLEILPKKGLRSLFIAGSMPDCIGAGQDLDIFIVIKPDELNEFLDILDKESKLFCRKSKSNYTFFRGPIKTEDKPLLHYIIYIDGKVGEVEAFQNEPPQVMEKICEKYDLVYGDEPASYTTEMALSDSSVKSREEYMIKKAESYFKKHEITYRSWQKKEGNWKFVSDTIKLTSWQFASLSKYFKGYEPKK